MHADKDVRNRYNRIKKIRRWKTQAAQRGKVFPAELQAELDAWESESELRRPRIVAQLPALPAPSAVPPTAEGAGAQMSLLEHLADIPTAIPPPVVEPKEEPQPHARHETPDGSVQSDASSRPEGVREPHPPPGGEQHDPREHHPPPGGEQHDPGPTPGPGPLAAVVATWYAALLTWQDEQARELGAPIRLGAEGIQALAELARKELAFLDESLSARQIVIGTPIAMGVQNFTLRKIKERAAKQAGPGPASSPPAPSEPEPRPGVMTIEDLMRQMPH